MRKSNQIRDEIDALIGKLKEVDDKRFTYADVRVIAKVGILSALTAEMAEVSTRRIVNLTWALVILTAMLFIFTVVLCIDTHKISNHEKSVANATAQKQNSN